MQLFNFALATISFLAATVHCGKSFDTAGYLEIAKDVWFWDRYGLEDFASLYDDCQRLFDGLTAVQFKNATGPIEWVFSEDSYLVAAISGTCGFFVHANNNHIFIGIDDIRYMMNVTMSHYSGMSNDGHFRVALVEGEIDCDAPAPGSPGTVHWKIYDPDYIETMMAV